MPGILPMKVIKVGTNAQARIAQACDRCRSKKIRCDGVRPCCSQCANVGFECKTSDKLSRRAFPRGYTESLEERVRTLEAEVRDLKDLLDEKDEKIDLLSKMHSNRRPSTAASPLSSEKKEVSVSPPKDDVFHVQASPLLLGVDNSDSYFMGASSGRAFINAFKRKMQESEKSLAGLNIEAFLNTEGDTTPVSHLKIPKGAVAPPRMFSDRCVNIYFQEWAPLFPVLHRPSFLRMYERYLQCPEQLEDDHKLAQLNLVLGIAGLSSDNPDRQQIALRENQWRLHLDAIVADNTLATLQCLVLALIYCISKGDYSRLQYYKGIAVGLSHRLGLHQSQKRFSFGALTMETRKRVFWTLYTIDCFSEASLGFPKLLKEEDVLTEFPSDTDDEYVTEKGYQPTLPGESTRISSALALFRASRILSKVLEQNYPAAATHELSLQALTNLDNELKEWSDSLPQHLKLTFVQDKPSTDITGNRSALLSLAYYYIRSLIHRPAIGSTLGNKSSPSVMSLADSSKHIIQIVQLLEERSMSFSFCLNKNEMLTLCGLSLLYHGMDLKQEGKLMRDSQRLVSIVIRYLEKGNSPTSPEFKMLAASMMPLEVSGAGIPAQTPKGMAAPVSTKSTPSPSISRTSNARRALYRHMSASMSEDDLRAQQENLRRATLPNVAIQRKDYVTQSRSSLESTRSDVPQSKREYRNPISHIQAMLKPRIVKTEKPPNLDYLSLSNTPVSSQPQSPSLSRTQSMQHRLQIPIFHSPSYPNQNMAATKAATTGPTEWEVLLGSIDGGQTNLYDAIYGGPALSIDSSTYGDWSPESQWDIPSLNMGDFTSAPGPARSVLSFSEESLSSGEDLSESGLGLGRPDFGGHGLLHNRGEGYLIDGLDGNFGLS